jgi:hypothetical protein
VNDRPVWTVRGPFVVVVAYLGAITTLAWSGDVWGDSTLVRGTAVSAWLAAFLLNVRLYLASRAARGPVLVILWFLVASVACFVLFVVAARALVSVRVDGVRLVHVAAIALLLGPAIAKAWSTSPLVSLLPAPSPLVVAVFGAGVLVSGVLGGASLLQCVVASAFVLTALEHGRDEVATSGCSARVASACGGQSVHGIPS